MRIVNYTDYPDSILKSLFKFASRGIRDSGIEIHIKGTNNGLRGRCFYWLPDYARVASSSKHLITLKLPYKPEGMPQNAWTNVKRIKKLWPNKIPFDNWQDAVLFIAAHEFRHIWQENRRLKTKKGGKQEYDATKFAHIRLNQWREKTGRVPVPAIKQPNPFLQEVKDEISL